MALVLKGKKLNLTINSNMIIGVMGKEREVFFKSLKGNNLSYVSIINSYNGNVQEIIKKYYHGDLAEFKKNLLLILDEFGLNEDILNYDYANLSDSEKSLLRYILLFINKPKIIVIDEPFLSLDYVYKKKIVALFRKIIYQTNLTIIVGSNSSDLIYEICKKVLLIKNNEYYYGDKEKVLTNSFILEKYDIIKPKLVQFVDLVREKQIHLDYVCDVRDLIKEVYKNV